MGLAGRAVHPCDHGLVTLACPADRPELSRSAVPVLPGAEPFSADGGDTGVLLCHGFTGSPQSLRPWAEALARAGHTVRLPLLPGHGTTWQDMNRSSWRQWYDEVDAAFTELRSRCSAVFVAGLSMGGALALRLAEQHGENVAGLVLVNPAVHVRDRRLLALPVLRRGAPSVPPVRDDIKKPRGTQLALHPPPPHPPPPSPPPYAPRPAPP